MEIAAHQCGDEQPGHPGWDDEQASLHLESGGPHATMGERDARSEFCLCKYNAAPHVALGTVEFQHQRDVEVMDWPAMGPDTNQIEHAWD